MIRNVLICLLLVGGLYGACAAVDTLQAAQAAKVAAISAVE